MRFWQISCNSKNSTVTSYGLQAIFTSKKMAESQNVIHPTIQSGGKYCVTGLPNNVSCNNISYNEEISMHRFPNHQETWQKSDTMC